MCGVTPEQAGLGAVRKQAPTGLITKVDEPVFLSPKTYSQTLRVIFSYNMQDSGVLLK